MIWLSENRDLFIPVETFRLKKLSLSTLRTCGGLSESRLPSGSLPAEGRDQRSDPRGVVRRGLHHPVAAEDDRQERPEAFFASASHHDSDTRAAFIGPIHEQRHRPSRSIAAAFGGSNLITNSSGTARYVNGYGQLDTMIVNRHESSSIS